MKKYQFKSYLYAVYKDKNLIHVGSVEAKSMDLAAYAVAFKHKMQKQRIDAQTVWAMHGGGLEDEMKWEKVDIAIFANPGK